MTDYELHPAYMTEKKARVGTDFIDVPVYDQDEARLEDERIIFEYSQYNNYMIIFLGKHPYYADLEDVKNTIQDVYKNFKIEYK